MYIGDSGASLIDLASEAPDATSDTASAGPQPTVKWWLVTMPTLTSPWSLSTGTPSRAPTTRQDSAYAVMGAQLGAFSAAVHVTVSAVVVGAEATGVPGSLLGTPRVGTCTRNV